MESLLRLRLLELVELGLELLDLLLLLKNSKVENVALGEKVRRERGFVFDAGKFPANETFKLCGWDLRVNRHDVAQMIMRRQFKNHVPVFGVRVEKLETVHEFVHEFDATEK